jgi:hypothetical protein
LELFRHRDRINSDGLRKIFIALDSGYETLFYDILNTYQNDTNSVVYVQMLNRAFGVQPNEDFCQDMLRYITESQTGQHGDETGSDDPDAEKLTDLVEETPNPIGGPGVESIIRYLTYRISQVSDYAEIPKYIRQYEIDTRNLPQVRIIDVDPDLDPRELAAGILTEAENYNLYVVASGEEDPEIAREAAISQLANDISQMSLDKRVKYLAPFKISQRQIQEIQDNEDLFRILGPVNPHPGDDYADTVVYDEDEEAKPNLDKIYGGPRMFISIEYEHDHDNDLEKDDWFDGVCQQCIKNIRKRHYARRRALIPGGWLGCFCSHQCVRTNIMRNRSSEDPEDIKIVELELALNDQFDALLEKIGIAERDTGEVKTELEDTAGEHLERYEAFANTIATLNLDQPIDIRDIDDDRVDLEGE